MKEKTKRKRPNWLTRNVLVVSWVSLLQDAASEMLYPILPVFLNTVLGAPAIVIGVIESVAEGMMALTKLLSSKINIYLPRKLMVFLGYAAATVGKIVIALASMWPVVLLGRAVDRLGKGIRSAPRDAVLMVGTQAHQRGRIFGFHRSMDTAGAVVGPILGLLFLALFDDNIRSVLWIAIVPAIASTALVLFINDGSMKWGKGRPGTSLPQNTQNTTSSSVTEVPSSGQLPAALKRLVNLLAIFSLFNFPDALLLLHLSLSGFSPAEVVGAYLLFNIAYAVLSFPFGMLADRFPSKYIYALGLLCFAATYSGLAMNLNWVLTFCLMAVYGAFAAANDTVGKSWAAKLAPEHLQLAAQARLQGFSGFGILIAGIWAGLMWPIGEGNGMWPLFIAAGMGVLIAVYVAVFAPVTTSAISQSSTSS